MDFTARSDLKQVFVTFADTVEFDPVTKRYEPKHAGLVFVLRLSLADRDVLLEFLSDDWGERVKLIFSQCVCDEHGRLPGEAKLAEVFARFDLPTTETVHRECCAWNGIPYLEFPKDERANRQPDAA